MKILVVIMSLFLFSGAFAGSELDNEDQVKNNMVRPANLPETIVIRVNEKNNEVQIFNLKEKLVEENINAAQIEKLKFTTVEVDKVNLASNFTELDKDQSTESWYFYYGYNPYYSNRSYVPYVAPYYSYYYTPYGYYNYNSYYNYAYNGWNYSYYNPYNYYAYPYNYYGYRR